MDSQMERPHGHRYEQEPHNAGLHAAEGENEHRQEKSVLKKVKAKARKIKHTLKLHGHGHNYDQNLHREGHIPDDHDLDKEDDKNEEFDDPEVRNGGGGSSGEEVGVTPILRSFDKMNLSDEPKPVNEENLPTRKHDHSIFPTGSHDQFSPEPTPPIPITSKKTLDWFPRLLPGNPKISIVMIRLGYEEKDDAKEREMHQRQDKAKAASPMEYGKRIVTNVAERLSPAYEKVAETGSTVMSKVHGTRAGTGFEVERKANKQDRRVSVKDYVAEKLKPGEEDGALSELISEALHKKKRGEEAIGKYGREFWRTCGSKFCARSWECYGG
ncbi:hypothetical protein GH714_040138 [Hevea brasiliensis]|uniref:Uncharacterized protein n=1 Tax=Hevea brasiliensis TaxID=3981 RepID=A0A6A6MQY3_HEVBR|nr:hypothetical protein GH714_040138 [Hevea brasiliensis]